MVNISYKLNLFLKNGGKVESQGLKQVSNDVIVKTFPVECLQHIKVFLFAGIFMPSQKLKQDVLGVDEAFPVNLAG